MSEEERSVLVLNSQKPALQDGYLTVKVPLQTIKVRGNECSVPELRDGKITVAVQGPRFNLLPQDIVSVYPPPGGIVHHGGDNPRVIPHVMLTRSTVPWERTPGVKARGEPRPWLALLVIDQNAATDHDPQNFSHRTGVPGVKEPDGVYSVPKDWELTGAFHAPSLPGPPWKAPEAMQLMKLSWEGAKALLPSWEHLRLLAHVRETPKRKDDATSPSVIVASPNLVTREMPQPQHRLSAHLVSLENWYKDGSLVTPAPETTPVLLVVLKSWTYISAQITGSSIDAVFDSLKRGKDVLRIGNTPKADAAPPAKPVSDADYFQSRGFAILPHLRRSGRLTMSFYRGPLAPWAGANNDKASRDLVAKHSALGLSDVTYDAARELGRLMMLHDPRASRELMNWKMQQLQQAAQAMLAKSGHVHRVDHLPAKSSPPAPFPQEWFNRLLRLEGVPFGYLVPDERMLPLKPKEETIRFFEVERAWIEALVVGAFSVGPNDASLGAMEDQRKTLCNQILCRGFLLRSSIVSDWPQLHFTPEPDQEKHVVRRLSADVELHLFSAAVTTVTMALPPEALHFEWPPHSGPDKGKKWKDHTLKSSSDFAAGCLHTGRELTFKFV